MEALTPYIGVIVGGLIGFLSSIGAQLVIRWIDRRGNIRVYCKRTNAGSMSWGFHDMGTEIWMYVPLDIELQNTSNTTRVIRDFLMAAYKDGSLVFRCYQTDGLTSTKYSGAEITDKERKEFGDKNHSYSFVLPPRSIQKQSLGFAYLSSKASSKDKRFNEMRVEFFDERDRRFSYHLVDIEGDWEPRKEKADIAWIPLSDRKACRMDNKE